MSHNDNYIDFESNCQYYNIGEFNFEDKNNFVIFNHNVRSFAKNFDELSVYLNDLNVVIDVLVLTETWFSDFNTCDIDGYNAFHTFRSDRRGGGVSIFVRETLKSRLLSEQSCVTDFLECCSVEISGSSSMGDVIVNGVYRPPNSCEPKFNDRIVEDLLSDSHNKKVIICGDLNIDIISPNVDAQNLMHTLSSFNFLPLITLPTRETDLGATCIDHIWYNGLNSYKSGIYKNHVTDHYTVFASIVLYIPETVKVVNFRDHCKDNIDKFKSEIHTLNELYFNCTNDMSVNDRTMLFNDALFSLYNNCCPVRSKQLSSKRITKPWLSNNLLICIRRKYMLFKRYKNNEVSFNEYNDYKNYVSREVKAAKRNFFKNRFDRCRGDLRRTWNNINYIMNGKRKKDSVSLSDNDGEIHNNPTTVSNMFCKYFSEIAEKIEKDIPQNNIDPLSYVNAHTPNSFYAFKCTSTEVNKLIMSLPNKKCNIDSIPTFILKLVADNLSLVICDLFNRSINEGMFPDCLKTANIVPIYKSSDPLLVQNYRPISLLHYLSKLFEKLMYVRMISLSLNMIY